MHLRLRTQISSKYTTPTSITFLLLLQCIKQTKAHSHIPSLWQYSFHAFRQAVNPTISTRNFTELLLHDFKKSSRFFIPEFKSSFISSSMENDRTLHFFSSFSSSLANNLFLFSRVIISALVSCPQKKETCHKTSWKYSKIAFHERDNSFKCVWIILTIIPFFKSHNFHFSVCFLKSRPLWIENVRQSNLLWLLRLYRFPRFLSGVGYKLKNKCNTVRNTRLLRLLLYWELVFLSHPVVTSHPTCPARYFFHKPRPILQAWEVFLLCPGVYQGPITHSDIVDLLTTHLLQINALETVVSMSQAWNIQFRVFDI